MPTPLAETSHVLLVGYGRVGKILAAGLARQGVPLVVIEQDAEKATAAAQDGHEIVRGNAVEQRVLDAAGLERATRLLIAVPEGFEGGAIAQKARFRRPDIRIIARAHSDDEVAHLSRLGADDIVMGERELAARMLTLAAG